MLPTIIVVIPILYVSERFSQDDPTAELGDLALWFPSALSRVLTPFEGSLFQ